MTPAATQPHEPNSIIHSLTPGSTTDNAERLASTGLQQFFDNVSSPDWWRVAELDDHFRIAYIGTPTSNLAHLVTLRRSNNAAYVQFQATQQQGSQGAPREGTVWPQLPPFLANGNSYPTNDATWSGPGWNTPISLHHPYPQIRPLNPWNCPPQFSLYPSEELATDLSSFPKSEVREALIRAYFQHIHPVMPIVAKSTFMDSNGNLRHRPPLLLCHAVLLAGAHVCTHELVAKDRRLVKSVQYRRASMLFHLRHETDRLHLAQAALLFTWYINDGDTISGGPWYWTGEAMRVACGLGLHRRNNRLPTFDRIMYKRIFWPLFVAEVFTSLETGRPCSIRAEDIDQSPLSEDDFNKGQWTQHSPNHPQEDNSQVSVNYHLRMAELAYIALEILSLNAPSASARPEISSIDSRLALWLISSDLSSKKQGEEFFTHQLRIHYYQVVLHLHRNNAHEVDNSRTMCNTASEAIVTGLEQIAALNELNRCHFTVVGAVVAAGIQLIHEIRSAVLAKALLVALELSGRLKRLLACTKMLAESWPNAEAVFNAFGGVSQEYESRLSEGLCPSEPVELPDFEPDWNSLFASLPLSTEFEDTTGQDWLFFTD